MNVMLCSLVAHGSLMQSNPTKRYKREQNEKWDDQKSQNLQR
jgi:hypothetical protein